MNNRNDIQEELKSMGSALAGMPREMPYHVPSGYFTTAESELLHTISSLNEPDAQPTFGKVGLPYSVPSTYFEQLLADVTANAAWEDKQNDVTREMPYTIPDSYFEELPGQMLIVAKAGKQIVLKPSKIIPFRPVKWAAAAMILICITAGSYITFFSKGNVLSADKILASVPNSELHDYLQGTYVLDIDRVTNNTDINKMDLDNKDIIQYLNETGWDATE